MIDQLIVFQEDYPAIVFIMVGLLLLILVLREWFRESKRRRGLRIFAAIMVSIALLGIIAVPSVRRPIERSNLVVLTEGFEQEQLDSLNRELPKFARLRTDSILNTSYPDLNEFGQIFVLGNGIPHYDLWQFKGRTVTYLPGQIENGITQLSLPNLVYEEAEMIVRGMLKTDLPDVKLVLNGPEGKLDSVLVDRDGRFELNTSPKTIGNILYTILNSSSNKIEQLPITVLPKKQLKVLIINAFPTFETRYLKAFLSRKGHEVVVRNQLSKDVFKYEYFNTNKRNINSLSQAELEKHDLAIIDFASLANFSKAEQQLLNTAIKEEGMGLFIQSEQALFSNNNWINLQGKKTAVENILYGLKTDTVTLAKYGFDFNRQANQYTLLESTENEPLTLAERNGMGKVGTTVLRDVYRQQLTGDSLIYARIWTNILDGLSKENNDKVNWTGLDQIVYPLEPMDFTVQNLKREGIIIIEEQQLPLAQDASIPEQWNSTYWPRRAGWHKAIAGEDSTAFYVYEKGDWDSRKAYASIEANHRYFAQQSNVGVKQNYDYKRIPKIWLYLLFLLTIGFLWLEPKL